MRPSISTIIRPIYLYSVCLVTIIVFIIGAVSITNLLLRTYVFGLESTWYNDPVAACEYILTQEQLPPETGGTLPRPVVPPGQNGDFLTTPTPEERTARYERCITRETENIRRQARFEFANSMSNGIAMIIIALPIFAFHWGVIRKDRKAKGEE